MQDQAYNVKPFIQPPHPPLQPQLLQRPLAPMPAPAPHPTTNVPPLRGTLEEGSVSVISLDKKGKGVEKDSEVMQVNEARINKDSTPMANDDEAEGSQRQRKRKKRASQPQRKIEIKDFPLGATAAPYDLIEDVSTQYPRIMWPQLLHLSPKM